MNKQSQLRNNGEQCFPNWTNVLVAKESKQSLVFCNLRIDFLSLKKWEFWCVCNESWVQHLALPWATIIDSGRQPLKLYFLCSLLYKRKANRAWKMDFGLLQVLPDWEPSLFAANKPWIRSSSLPWYT